MSHVVFFDGESEPIDVDTKEGAYQHIALVLRKYGAPSPVFSSLGKLFPGHTEKAANELWNSVTDCLNQFDIETIERLHSKDLAELGII